MASAADLRAAHWLRQLKTHEQTSECGSGVTTMGQKRTLAITATYMKLTEMRKICAACAAGVQRLIVV